MENSTNESFNKSNSVPSTPSDLYSPTSKDPKKISFLFTNENLNTDNQKPIPKCFSCDIDDCTSLFETENELLNHKKTCHTKIFKCPFLGCEKTFEKTVNLNKHYKSHFPSNKKYHCPYPGCNKSFTASYNLTIHYRMHTGDQPYCCEKCGMKFFVRANYKYHVNVKHNIITLKEKCCQHKGCSHKSKTGKQKMIHHDKLEEECKNEKNNLISLLMAFQNSISDFIGNINDVNNTDTLLDQKKQYDYKDKIIDIQKQSKKLYECAVNKDQYKGIINKA